ncbi:MAG: DUF3558 family protein [Propionibacteriales bacterium]|nr:DUF3558 family protein [Propionibacteriales bacterium]
MRIRRTLPRLAATAFVGVLALGALTGCGSDEPKADSPGTSAGTDQTPGPASDETDTASGGLIDICTLVTEAEISDLLGGPVTSEEIPGGGCNFSNEDDPRAASVSLNSSVLDEGAGGFEGSVAGISGVLQGDAGSPLDGVGDQAYVKTGTFGGGETVRGSGLVRVGTNVFQVDLSPDPGTNATKVRSTVVDILTLISTKA